MAEINGILPILHTPFDSNDQIDQTSLQREIDWAFEQGVRGVCCAMVSEILRLTSQERFDLNRMVVEMTGGRGVVVASVGAESTKQAIEYANQSVADGCNAIMAIPPISTALPLDALYDYFSTLAKSVTVLTSSTLVRTHGFHAQSRGQAESPIKKDLGGRNRQAALVWKVCLQVGGCAGWLSVRCA